MGLHEEACEAVHWVERDDGWRGMTGGEGVRVGPLKQTGRDRTGGSAGGGKEWVRVRVCLASPDGPVISHIHKSD